jgi:hypothetical protein
VESAERKKSSLFTPKVRSFSLPEKKDTFICGGSEAGCSKPSYTSSSLIIERRDGMNFSVWKQLKGDI